MAAAAAAARAARTRRPCGGGPGGGGWERVQHWHWAASLGGRRVDGITSHRMQSWPCRRRRDGRCSQLSAGIHQRPAVRCARPQGRLRPPAPGRPAPPPRTTPHLCGRKAEQRAVDAAVGVELVGRHHDAPDARPPRVLHGRGLLLGNRPKAQLQGGRAAGGGEGQGRVGGCRRVSVCAVCAVCGEGGVNHAVQCPVVTAAADASLGAPVSTSPHPRTLRDAHQTQSPQPPDTSHTTSVALRRALLILAHNGDRHVPNPAATRPHHPNPPPPPQNLC